MEVVWARVWPWSWGKVNGFGMHLRGGASGSGLDLSRAEARERRERGEQQGVLLEPLWEGERQFSAKTHLDIYSIIPKPYELIHIKISLIWIY